MRRRGSNPTTPTDGANRRPAAAADRPSHPTGQAVVLLVAVTLMIVGLAALSAWGLI